MFSDLVGSTALSARMDPEDLREVTSAYQKRVAETVQRLGGFVAKYYGRWRPHVLRLSRSYECERLRGVFTTGVSIFSPATVFIGGQAVSALRRNPKARQDLLLCLAVQK
jgi:hypothetical protein